MANSKPEVTATIKFRGVTIEGMTIQELRELRDVLNQLVGEKVTERVVERYPYYPYYTPVITSSGTWTIGTGGLSLSSCTTHVEPDGNYAHYTISCN